MDLDPFAAADVAFKVFDTETKEKNTKRAAPPEASPLPLEDTLSIKKKRRIDAEQDEIRSSSTPTTNVEGQKTSDIELSYELCKHVVSFPKDYPPSEDILNPPFPQTPGKY